MNPTPVLLLILDGFGYSEDPSDNAIANAYKPNWDRLWATCPHTLINASEHFVGLPDGQMGNSEVGHLNIGGGRVVYQDLERVNLAIANGDFQRHPVLNKAVDTVKANGGTLHVFGLLSDGGVHSHEHHIHGMVQMAAKAGLTRIAVHAFLDGRDTPPQSAALYLQRMEQAIAEAGAGRIASVTGRYYAMDRDKRWERVELAYRAIAEGQADYHADSAAAALEAAYARGENDEFVKPTLIGAASPVQDGDVIVFMNFRSDRAREISSAFLDPAFSGFARPRQIQLGGYCTLTQYSNEALPWSILFEPQPVKNGFGEYIAGLGLKQLRIAETEKYPHVTFFFNGGEEQVYPGEDRIMVPSPKVATYDLQPEMSVYEVTDKLVAAILSQQYQAIICNFANADMVGHTGSLEAATKAIEAVDVCIGRVVEAMRQIGGEVIITADHGNAECMVDHQNHQPHTQHTTNLVPLIYVGRPATIREGGALCDLAPSLLRMMGLPQPAEMTGQPLLAFAHA